MAFNPKEVLAMIKKTKLAWQSFTYYCLILVLISAFSSQNVEAQPSFSESLDAVEKERTYEKFKFDYTMVIRQYGRDEGSKARLLVLEEGSCSGFPKRGLWLVQRIDKVLERNPENKDTSEIAKKQEESQLAEPWRTLSYSLYKDGKIHTISSDSKYVAVRTPDRPLPFPVEPFDFRALGLGYYGDLISGVSFEELLENSKEIREAMPPGSWGSGSEDGVVIFESKSTNYKIDLSKGSWPIYHHYLVRVPVLGKQVEKVLTRTNMRLEQFDGQWFPAYAKVESDVGEFELFLTWYPAAEIKEATFTLDYAIELLKLNTKRLRADEEERGQ